MVSKIAVMALVAIVAVPILLGYGMNMEHESYTAWVEDGNSQDLTNYLYSVVDASKRDYTNADIYQFNSKIFFANGVEVYPNYEYTSTTKTPILGNMRHIDSRTGSWPGPGLSMQFSQGIVMGGYDNTNYLSFTITRGGVTDTFDHIKSWYWTSDGEKGIIEYSLIEPGDYLDGGGYFSNVTAISVTVHGSPAYNLFDADASTNKYADISKGYRLSSDRPILTAPIPNIYDYINHGYGETEIYSPGICKDMVISFNLDSITEPSYYMAVLLPEHHQGINYYASLTLEKRTDASGVEWFYTVYGDNTEHPLYYNPDLSSNTYQLYLNGHVGGELRYVGAWSESINPAPVLITYPFTYSGEMGESAVDYLAQFYILGQTPIMRIDGAQVAAYEYKIIRDTTYDPIVFKDNPLTKLTNMAEWGTSLGFGGNTYTVTDGEIEVGTNKVSVKNLELSSVFNGSEYENTINGIVVSTSVTPSTITFNGDWSVTVSTVAQKSVEKEVTKWIPGKFAWNGMDDNFLMAGLMTSVGAFIGLGLYGRRTGARIMPLLLVCVGAAFMFILMM